MWITSHMWPTVLEHSSWKFWKGNGDVAVCSMLKPAEEVAQRVAGLSLLISDHRRAIRSDTLPHKDHQVWHFTGPEVF